MLEVPVADERSADGDRRIHALPGTDCGTGCGAGYGRVARLAAAHRPRAGGQGAAGAEFCENGALRLCGTGDGGTRVGGSAGDAMGPASSPATPCTAYDLPPARDGTRRTGCGTASGSAQCKAGPPRRDRV